MISCRCLHHAGLSWFVQKLGYVPNALHVWDRLPIANFNNPKLGFGTYLPGNLSQTWWDWDRFYQKFASSKRWKEELKLPSSHGILVPQSAGGSQFSPIKILPFEGEIRGIHDFQIQLYYVIFPRWSRKTSMAKTSASYFFSMMIKSSLNTTKVKVK